MNKGKNIFLTALWLAFSLFCPLTIHEFFYKDNIENDDVNFLNFKYSTDNEEADLLEEFVAYNNEKILSEKAPKARYILYAHPRGELGSQLSRFWNDAKNQQLENPSIIHYPPHISLTGFFSYSSTKADENRLINALKYAIAPTKGVIPISLLSKTIYKRDKIDAILFKYSPVLAAVTVDFLDRAGLNFSLIRPKSNSKLGYHITLRQKTCPETTVKVRQLEDKNIDLNASNLQSNTKWALYIYKMVGDNLTVLHKKTIRTH